MSDISRRLDQIAAGLREAADAHLKPTQPPLKSLTAQNLTEDTLPPSAPQGQSAGTDKPESQLPPVNPDAS